MATNDGKTPNPPVKELRIQHIEEMMRNFTFVQGKTYRDLAKKWGLSEHTLREDTAAASKRIRAAVMDHDSVNAVVGVALEKALTGAINEKKWAVVAKLTDTWAKISGAGAAEKHEFSGAVATPTPAAAAALVREKFGEHAAKKDSGEALGDAGEVSPGSSGE